MARLIVLSIYKVQPRFFMSLRLFQFVMIIIDLPPHIIKVLHTSCRKPVELYRIIHQYAYFKFSSSVIFIGCFPNKAITLLDIF